MNWYYVNNGQQAGPVDEATLDGMAASGTINADTLVWSEEMNDWQPYGQARPGRVPAVAIAAPPIAFRPGPGQVVCAECGRVFPEEETISYANVRVCANCKPIFVQKLGEGLNVGLGPLTYARFWTRFVAVFLDGILLLAVSMIIRLAAGLGLNSAGSSASPAVNGLSVVLFFVQIAIALSYEAIMVGKYGATLGKMACKIRVVAPDGSKIGYGRAVGRYFAKRLSDFTCLIGYIIAAFDEEKRALHDRLCDTRVVMN
jgi:uncharacterized RDD family membrane protein YckC